MFLCLLIIDQQLPILPISQRLISRRPHHIKPALRLPKDRIDLLQGPIRRLRVEEIHDGEDEGVDHGEYYVGLVLYRAE